MEEILLFLFHVCGLIISCEIEEQGRVGSTKTCLGKFGELKLISQIFFFSSAQLKSQKKNGFSSNIVINLSLCMFICHKSYITGTKKKKEFPLFFSTNHAKHDFGDWYSGYGVTQVFLRVTSLLPKSGHSLPPSLSVLEVLVEAEPLLCWSA